MSDKPKILIVDDVDANRLLAKRILERENYRVLEAKSGMDAIILLGADPDIDVMLLDMRMPDMDGLEVLKITQDNPQTAKIKVIIISAISDVAEKVRAFSAGAADYIEKPFDKAELLARIETQVRLSRAEKALHRNQIKMRALLNAIPDLMFRINKEGIYLDCRGANTQALAMPAEQIVGKSMYDVLPKDVADRQMHYIHQTLKTGQLQIFEYQLMIRGLPYEFEARVVVSGKDEVLLMARDITERKQAEQSLQEEKALMDALMENSLDSIYFKDRQCRLTRINRKMMSDLNLFDTTQVLGKTDIDLFGRKFGEQTLNDDLKIIATGKPVVGSIESRTLDNGDVNWTMTTKVPLRNAGGKITGLVGITREINDIKQTMEELRKFSRAVEQSASVIVITDYKGNIEYVNPAFTRVTGYTFEEAIGKNPRVLKSGKHPPEFYKDMWSTITGGEVWQGEIYNKKKNGDLFWEYATISPVKDDDGKITHYVAIKEDITQRKLIQAELRQAKEAAEAATHAKSEFLANMSHEIRTPMNGVVGMTSLLLDTHLTTQQREFVEIIRTSSDALLTIINDILDFSKIEAGKLELEYQPFNLRRCVEEALDLIAPKAGEKGLDLAYLINDKLPPVVEGDITRLRQILVNLLGNAVKFTEQGEVVVSVIGRAEQDGYYKLHFAIKDTGIGIPEDRLNRLFQSFSQVDASTTRRYGGTGLGLAICKHLSEMMGGNIWVESKTGQGSIFHFTIQAKEIVQSIAKEKMQYLHVAQPHLVDKQILIVDDNETSRFILTRQTKSWGMCPTAVVSGLEALKLIQQNTPFDLAILDMQMPDMDGLTLAAEIQKSRTPQNLPLIMLSSLGKVSDTSTAQFSATLVKPIKPSQLYDVLIGIIAEQPVAPKRFEPQPEFDRHMGEQHPLRLLLAEDNVVNQKVALSILERIGYRADVAANGLEAVDAVKRQPYDVVLMDVQMPEMDGVEATQTIRRQIPAGQQPQIIAMTANALQGDREKYLSAGMDNYVSKPVQVDELIRALSQCQPCVSATDVPVGAVQAVPPAAPNKTKAEAFRQPEKQTLKTAANGTQPNPNMSSVATIPIDKPQNGHNDNTSVESAIDRVILKKFQSQFGEDGPELMPQLVGMFFENAPTVLEQLQQAINQKDVETINRSAHTLKSNSATFGAMTLSNLCYTLEKQTANGATEGVELIADKIYQAFTSACKELEQYLDQL